MGALLTPVFRMIFATQALYNLIAPASARKGRIHLATRKNKRIFIFSYFRDAAKLAARHATEDKNGIENDTQNATTNHQFLSIFHLSGCNFQKTPQNDLPEPPRAPRKRIQNRPKSRQELPKMDPGRSKKYFLGPFKKNKSAPFPLRAPS